MNPINRILTINRVQYLQIDQTDIMKLIRPSSPEINPRVGVQVLSQLLISSRGVRLAILITQYEATAKEIKLIVCQVLSTRGLRRTLEANSVKYKRANEDNIHSNESQCSFNFSLALALSIPHHSLKIYSLSGRGSKIFITKKKNHDFISIAVTIDNRRMIPI